MTAYDMRFSAWSSDVCASNLAEPAGCSASAIARALGWLVQRGAAVTTISLVGPNNKLLAAAISRAQRRGMLIVAAVGNDGPAAPPAYPASYKGVFAVTGRSAERRVGKECVSTGRFRWSPEP